MTYPDAQAQPPDTPSPVAQRVLVLAAQLVLIAVGLYVAVESRSLGLWTKLGPGPGLLPLILGVALVGLAAAWLVQTVLDRRRATKSWDDDGPAEPLDRPYILGVVGGLIVLAAVMELIGFQISMAVFLFAELMFLGRQKWWVAASVALVGSIGVFVLFDRVLAVQLPLSSLPFLSGLGL
ncbi:tripartite tricarboxylate transporter TctB family protein [Mycobacterium manitobense]|uniref:Tripartite tricarboxylate transporter TctB family protein n=1 Tax=[Mycobacterium] manitobense TaxID=190147 RepID=A0A9X2YWV0_9MYCO|nr:tripartite tricarboxylate transporter TctB family protein [[Mycobacterium] manitobense]MCV7173727.1 tripartite tricarboxylate transporter TctB family protein [[Mycobacterium] manitobense]